MRSGGLPALTLQSIFGRLSVKTLESQQKNRTTDQKSTVTQIGRKLQHVPKLLTQEYVEILRLTLI